MKEELSIENREALAAYRYQRAQETLAEVPFLRREGYYNTAINRLYYGCYYAAISLPSACTPQVCSPRFF